MKTNYLTLALLMLPVPALAQSTTECRRTAYGNVSCTTTPQAPTIDYDILTRQPTPTESLMRGMEAGERMREARERQQEIARQRDSDAKKSALRRLVGYYLSQKKCAEAESAALEAGEIELAASARRYCANSE